jgi:hypothetical protein
MENLGLRPTQQIVSKPVSKNKLVVLDMPVLPVRWEAEIGEFQSEASLC